MPDKKNYNQLLETLLGVFTIDKSKIKMLLMRKKTEPYKGYWVIPGSLVTNDETLETNISNVLTNIGLPALYNEQCYTFSHLDRNLDNRTIAISYIGLIDNITLYLKQEDKKDIELEWFDIDVIPKMGYDHEIIIMKLISYFKSKIVNSNILKKLFPSDFTLPELQHVYEQVLEVELDRRNFRKKLLNLGYIESTGENNEGYTGRPAKLYRFKDDFEAKDLF